MEHVPDIPSMGFYSKVSFLFRTTVSCPFCFGTIKKKKRWPRPALLVSPPKYAIYTILIRDDWGDPMWKSP